MNICIKKVEEKINFINSFDRKISGDAPSLKIVLLNDKQNTNSEEIEFLDNSFIKDLKPPTDSPNNNINEWFIQTLQKILKRYEILKKYASLRNMSSFFGLSKSYLYDKRYKKSVISHEYLDIMRKSIIQFTKKILKEDLDKEERARQARDQLISVIETYRQKYNPKLTANTQINEKLNIRYFHNITSIEQAYYLGLLFADGWITIQKSSSGGSTSYRISLSLKVEDKAVIERFAEAIGLNKSRVLERDSKDQRTGKTFRMAYLQFGVGSTSIKTSMAHDLKNLGITYKRNNINKRVKVPILPVFCNKEGYVNQRLMLAFLLGYFDGDGTLKESFSGEIYSNNFNFFTAIKEVYDLGKISKSRRISFDPASNTHKIRSLYSLFLNKKIFKEMMGLNLISMERKSVDAQKIDLNAPLMTKQRIWLKKEFSLNYLKQVLNTHSPSRIAKLIGFDHITFLKFLKNVYKIIPPNKGYYLGLSYQRREKPANNKLVQEYKKITKELLEIGKRNPFN